MAIAPEQASGSNLQPGTQNPQTQSGQLLTAPQTLQAGDQTRLLENKRATISVPSNPAPPTPTTPPPQASGINIFFIALALVALLCAMWFWRRVRRHPVTPAPAIEEIPTSPAPQPVTKTPAAKKSKPNAKSKSKRKKRARR